MSECENNGAKNCGNNHKHCWLKYAGIICATLVGSFLAFYVVADCALNYILSPAYAYNEFDEMDKQMYRNINRMNADFDKMMKDSTEYSHKSAVEFIRTPEAYKFVVDLTPFDGNTEDIKVDVDGHRITISGEANSDKNNVKSYTKMSQTYTLINKAQPQKLSKKKVDNKYIITVPIED